MVLSCLTLLLVAASALTYARLSSDERQVIIPPPAREGDDVDCKDVADLRSCKMWAGPQLTGCLSSPGHMALSCPRTCKMCHLRNAKSRCNFLQNDDVAMRHGDFSKLFANLTATPKLEVNADGSTTPTDTYLWTGRNNRPYTIHQLSSAPPIVLIDNVLSPEEADELIEIAHSTGFSGSTTTGEVDETGTINRRKDMDRTSQQAWCQGSCDDAQLVNTLYDRIHEITTVPPSNYEHLQLLKYEVGQKYNVHHDLLGLDPVVSACGPRILTFFVYLSDVEAGGETDFPELGLKIAPKKGSAVLWTNVPDDDFDGQESQTMHAALPVKKGRKYAANAWIHLKDYRFVNLWACSG